MKQTVYSSIDELVKMETECRVVVLDVNTMDDLLTGITTEQDLQSNIMWMINCNAIVRLKGVAISREQWIDYVRTVFNLRSKRVDKLEPSQTCKDNTIVLAVVYERVDEPAQKKEFMCIEDADKWCNEQLSWWMYEIIEVDLNTNSKSLYSRCRNTARPC